MILVEPNGPINIGSIARLCLNFKVQELRLVSPQCDLNSLDLKKMALKGIKFINKSNVFDNLYSAVSDCDLVLATCGRINKSKDSKFDSIDQITNWVKDFDYTTIDNLAIIFGREDRGLTNKELLLAQKVFTIDTDVNFPSLNLSHAVSIVLYEFFKINNNKFTFEANSNKKKKFKQASSNQIEDSFDDIKKLLLKIGYLLPHTSNVKISKFKKYILRAQTSDLELNTIRGIVNQINWALKNLKNK